MDMNRNRDQQSQGNKRQSQGQDRNRDMQGGRSQEHQSAKQWDGTERRTGAERRIDYGNMEMNEGSSR